MFGDEDRTYYKKLAELTVKDFSQSAADTLLEDIVFKHQLATELKFSKFKDRDYHKAERYVSILFESIAKSYKSTKLQRTALERDPETKEKIAYFKSKGITPEELTTEHELEFLFQKYGTIGAIMQHEQDKQLSWLSRQSKSLKGKIVIKMYEISYGKGFIETVNMGAYNRHQKPVFEERLRNYELTHRNPNPL